MTEKNKTAKAQKPRQAPHPGYAVLGPFSARDVTVLASVLVMLIASVLPLLGGAFFASMWNYLPLYFLAIGVVLPLAVGILFLGRRFAPNSKLRVGSLSVDQFASVTASFATLFFFLYTVTDFRAAFLLGLIGSLGLLSATVTAPLVPAFNADFAYRPTTTAHLVARDAIRAPYRPQASSPIALSAGPSATVSATAPVNDEAKMPSPVAVSSPSSATPEPAVSSAASDSAATPETSAAPAASKAAMGFTGIIQMGRKKSAGAGSGAAATLSAAAKAAAGGAGSATSDTAASAGAGLASGSANDGGAPESADAAAGAGAPFGLDGLDKAAGPDTTVPSDAPAASEASVGDSADSVEPVRDASASVETEAAADAASVGGPGAASGRETVSAGEAHASSGAEAADFQAAGAQAPADKTLSDQASSDQAHSEDDSAAKVSVGQVPADEVPAELDAGELGADSGARNSHVAEAAHSGVTDSDIPAKDITGSADLWDEGNGHAAEQDAGAPTQAYSVTSSTTGQHVAAPAAGETEAAGEEAAEAPAAVVPAVVVEPIPLDDDELDDEPHTTLYEQVSETPARQSIGATVDPATRPVERDESTYEPFWFAVEQTQAVEDETTGKVLYNLEPGAWILALADRGHDFLVQNAEGQVGVLRDLSGIERAPESN